MDLQTMGDNALTSENASPPTTYVRIPHKQPTTADCNRTPQRAIRLPDITLRRRARPLNPCGHHG